MRRMLLLSMVGMAPAASAGAWAQDDPVALAPVVRFHDALISAGHKPEVHAYSAGGHGFGMRKQGTSSDHWIDALYYWSAALGFTRPPGKTGR